MLCICGALQTLQPSLHLLCEYIRKDKYSKKGKKHKVDVEDESESYDAEEEREQQKETKKAPSSGFILWSLLNPCMWNSQSLEASGKLTFNRLGKKRPPSEDEDDEQSKEADEVTGGKEDSVHYSYMH